MFRQSVKPECDPIGLFRKGRETFNLTTMDTNHMSEGPDPVLGRTGAALCILLCLPGTAYLLLHSLFEVVDVGDVERSGWLMKKLSYWNGVSFGATLYFGLMLDAVAFILTILLTFGESLSLRMKAILWLFLIMSLLGFSAATKSF